MLVVAATRDRNIACAAMVRSFIETSSLAELAIYVDDDQKRDYQNVSDTDRVHIHIGPRIGPVASLNALVEQFPGHDIYGAVTDDCFFLTRDWDQWALAIGRSFRNGIGVCGPHTMGSRMPSRIDFPFATRRWIDAVGHFALPDCYHYYWDVVIENTARHIGACERARPNEFAILHDDFPSPNLSDHLASDAKQAIRALAFEQPKWVKNLQEARCASQPQPA